MLGFTHAIQTDMSVSEEKKEPEPIPLHDQENGADLKQPAQSILLPQYSERLRETNRGSLPKPPLLRRSVQLTSGEVPLKRDPNVIPDSAVPPAMNGMMASQAGIAIQPENQYLAGVPHNDDDDNEREASIHEQPVTTTPPPPQDLPVMEDLSSLPTMDGMVLPQPDTTIQPENQYFSFKLDDDDDDDDSESESNIPEQSMANPSPQNLPIMEGISVQPPFNQTTIPGMGDCGPSTIVPTPSPYPTPNVPLPTVPVISASILPSTQTNSYSDAPSLNSAAHSASSTDLNASMQSTLTDLDLPYPHIADELGISYPQLADQLNDSETKPSEAPAVKNGFSFPNPPTLNQTVQSNRGAAQPGTISVILPPITTVNEGQVSSQESLRIPSSSCRNAIL